MKKVPTKKKPPVKLTDKQKLFCNEYLIDFNATKAAQRAGYSEETAYSIGWENLRKPEIKNYIEKCVQERIVRADETKKLLSDIARGSVNDYLSVRMVEERKKVNKPLRVKIQELQQDIKKKRRIQELSDWSEERSDENFKEITYLEEEILRYEVELEFNPKASIIEYGAPELVERIEIDMVKLAKDKENGRIKALSFTEFGPKVELYAADAALVNLAKVHGIFAPIKQEVDLTMPLTPEQRLVRLKELKGKLSSTD